MLKNKTNAPIFTLNCAGRLLTVDRPLVMGILNLTPDSFYEGSRVRTTDDVVVRAGQMLRDGAAIIDIGGQSTRPGSQRLTAREEMARVLEPIRAIHNAYPEACISVDTYHAAVAEAAVHAGAAMVNDISGGQMDPLMLRTTGALNVPYVCMHIQGTPDTMQANPQYEDIVSDILAYFVERLAACHEAGIKDVLVDPGIGFGKTVAHNFELMNRLAALHILDKPLLVGLSRKSFIYKTLGVTAEEAGNGTTVMHTLALLQGAHILRVHDVKEAVQAVQLLRSCSNLTITE